MPSAVDRVRFSRFVERALAVARERGMTAAQVEAETKISLSTIHRWRRGEIAPTVDKVRQFCAGLGLSSKEALAALGLSERDATPPEPITDPDMLALLRKLQDPNTNEETKTYIRTTLHMLANMPAQPPRRRKAG
jgi:transcriptional regulator with XRE-family HTH domain